MGDFCFLNEGTKNRYFPTASFIHFSKVSINQMVKCN